MANYPRPEYAKLHRYQPDQTPVAVDLSDNRNMWGAHPAAVAVLQGATGAIARYPDPYGNPLRGALAQRLGVDDARVTTGAGASGVLEAIFRCSRSTEVRALTPGWPAAQALARVNGHTISKVPWQEGLDDPDAFVGSTSGFVYVANPNNPTGVRIATDWLRQVQRKSEDVGSILVLDAAYGDFIDDPEGDPGLGLALAGERTIWVKTMSKCYGLAGLRVGYGVASEALVLEVDKARGPFTLAAITSEAAAKALVDDSGWLERVIADTVQNRSRLIDSLGHRGLEPTPSQTNFVFIPLPPEQVAPAADGLRRFGVRVRPFAMPTAGGSGLRATVGPWDAMQRLLDGLDRLTAEGIIA